MASLPDGPSTYPDPTLFHAWTVGPTLDPIRAVGGLQVIPDCSIGDHPAFDIIVVPGGYGTRNIPDGVVDWIAQIAPTLELTTSVCTGAFLLAGCQPARWQTGNNPLGKHRSPPGEPPGDRCHRRSTRDRHGRHHHLGWGFRRDRHGPARGRPPPRPRNRHPHRPSNGIHLENVGVIGKYPECHHRHRMRNGKKRGGGPALRSNAHSRRSA